MGIKLRVFEKDIRNPEMYNEYIKKLVELKVQEKAFPALIIDNVVLQGEEEIEKKLLLLMV